jgi:hypothetical protein
MHYFIYPTQDTWISSGSNRVTGVSEKDQNFGRDEILEVKKEFYNGSFDYPTRALIQFSGADFTFISESVANGTIAPNPKFFLKLFEAEGNTDLADFDYTLSFQPISQSWTEGTGKFGDNPKVTEGCSWENRSNVRGGSAITWDTSGVDVLSVSSSTQTFDDDSSDINVDISNMVNMWINGEYDNHGTLIRFSTTQETDSTTQGKLKFFSRNTNTIFQPKLEVQWDDHVACSGSNTGSLNQITSSGLVNNDINMIGLKEFYRESDKVKFRLKAREKFVKKTFSTSYQTATGSYIPEKSGSYSIKDVASDETIVPFSDYTFLSCDSKSNYFIQWLNTFEPDRVYKIIYKLKYDDGQEEIIDNDFEFKIKR